MKRWIEFEWGFGRMGVVSGRFVLDDTEWAKLQGAIGQELYFGEILGKHLEVSGELEAGDLKVVTDNQDWLNKAESLGIDLNWGYNPLTALDGEEDDGEEDDGEDDGRGC